MTTPTPENAPPGTEIVCVDDEPSDKYLRNARPPDSKDMDGLKRGEIYTVRYFVPAVFAASGFLVLVNELTRPYEPQLGAEMGYDVARFRLIHRAASPEFYTVKAPVDAEPVS